MAATVVELPVEVAWLVVVVLVAIAGGVARAAAAR